MAVQLAVLVHEPGHCLGVGPDVGSGDVALGSQHLLDLVHERAGDLLDLGGFELTRVDVHAALGAAEGDFGDRGLPRHQLRKGTHFVEVHVGVETDAALVGPAGAVVLHAVAVVDVHAPVRLLDRDLHLDLAVGGAQDGGQVVAQVHPLGRLVEPVRDDLVVGDLRGLVGRRGVGLGLAVSHVLLLLARGGALIHPRASPYPRRGALLRTAAPPPDPGYCRVGAWATELTRRATASPSYVGGDSGGVSSACCWRARSTAAAATLSKDLAPRSERPSMAVLILSGPTCSPIRSNSSQPRHSCSNACSRCSLSASLIACFLSGPGLSRSGFERSTSHFPRSASSPPPRASAWTAVTDAPPNR